MIGIRIEPLSLRYVIPLIRLRRQIEREALHLPIRVGERGESIFYTLARMFMTRKRVKTFIALDQEGKLVGYLWMVFGRFRKFKGNAYIAMVSVKPSHRGKGVGTSLIDAAEEHVRERKIRRLELEVFSKNSQAIALYERLGYQEEGRKRRAVENEGGLDDLVVMAKLFD